MERLKELFWTIVWALIIWRVFPSQADWLVPCYLLTYLSFSYKGGKSA